MKTLSTSFVVTRSQCLLCVLVLVIPMIFIVIHELEYSPYDTSTLTQLPSVHIASRSANNTRDFQSGDGQTSLHNASNHAFSSSDLNDIHVNSSKKTTIEMTKSENEEIEIPNKTLSEPIPYRNYNDKLIAFRRYLSGNGKIIVIHLRKAGGTTVEHWFFEINRLLESQWNAVHSPDKQWNSSVESLHKIAENNITWSMIADPFSIYVTSIRHPIDRILSQYEFEWRWGCQRCDYKDDMEFFNYSSMTDWSFMSRRERMDGRDADRKQLGIRKYATIDFNDWLHRLIRFEIENDVLGTARHQMQSVRSMYISNYILWIVCCPTRWCSIQRDFISDQDDDSKIRHCFEETIRILQSFDILLITEWLNDLRTQVYVNELFFNETRVDKEGHYLGMKDVNKPYPHHVVDKGKNYMISPENEEILYQLNYWDLRAYQMAKSISFARIHTAWKEVYDGHNESQNELLYDQTIETLLGVKDDMDRVFVPYKEMSFLRKHEKTLNREIT